MNNPDAKLDPTALALPDAVRLLTAVGQSGVTVEMLEADIAAGAPTKTTICECACIWAVLYGHRDFVTLIGSDEGHAMDMLQSIKMELEGNDLLLEDFPEVVYPIQSLDGIATLRRATRSRAQLAPLRPKRCATAAKEWRNSW